MTLLRDIDWIASRSDAAVVFLCEEDAKRLQENMAMNPIRHASVVSKYLNRSYVVIASPDGPLVYQL